MQAIARKLQTEVRVRYKPSPRFLDMRGSLASAGVDSGLYPLWRPAESQIELRGPDRYAQFGVTNATFLTRCTAAGSDSTETLLQFFFKQVETFARPTRFSVAARYVSHDSPPFDEMVQQAMGLSINRPLEFLGENKITDLGWLFDVEILGAVTLIRVGPMERSQIIDYVARNDFSVDHALWRHTIKEEELPEQAWFVGLSDHADVALGEDALVQGVTARLGAFDDFARKAVTGLAQLRNGV